MKTIVTKLVAALAIAVGLGLAPAGAHAADQRPAQLAERPTLTVVGDSIAFGFTPQIHLPGVDVVNGGNSGTCLGVRVHCPNRRPGTLIERLRNLDPAEGDMVLVSIGTNDLPYTKAWPMIEDYQRAIRFLDRSGARYWFATITPFTPQDEWRAGFNPTRLKVNDWLMRHVPTINTAEAVGGAYLAPRFDCGDGLHMSPLGNLHIAAAIQRAIRG